MADEGGAFVVSGKKALALCDELARLRLRATEADDLAAVLHLWMGGWRPVNGEWVNQWVASRPRRPMEPGHLAALDHARQQEETYG